MPPDTAAFLADVLAGLRTAPKAIPPKWFYDAEGSSLFEQITRTEAYYPTRTELGILVQHAGEIATAIGPRAALIEPGSGSSRKTRVLLDAVPDLAAYVPVDISAEPLAEAAETLRAHYPDLPVYPLVADFSTPFQLPPLPDGVCRRVVFFPGSTLGNFEPDEACALLARMAKGVGEGGGLVLGVDRKKARAVLEHAYDDPEGVTAAFNLNLLTRMNHELGADFDLQAWSHRAVWNEERGRVEMHLVSRCAQTAHVGGEAFAFAEGETIHTESAYKYGPGQVEAVAAEAGWTPGPVWTDPDGWFAVHYFEVRG